MRKLIPLLIIIFFSLSNLKAQNVYVSAENGSDSNAGTVDAPFLTIAKGAAHTQSGDTCFIKEGVYREVLKPSFQGTGNSPVVFTNYMDDSVVVSATELVTAWDHHEGNIYRAKVTMNLGRQNAVYCDGKLMDFARWPNNTDNDIYTIDAKLVTSGTASTIVCADLPDIDYTGGYIWYLGAHCGMSWTRPITSQSGNTVTFPAVDITKWPFNPHNPTVYRNGNRGRYFVFGTYAALDYEREWFYDDAKDSLYIILPGNAHPADFTIEVASRTNTFNINKSFVTVDGVDAFGGVVEITAPYAVVKNGHLSNCYQALDALNNTSAQVGEGAVEIKAANVTITRNIIEYGSLNGIYLQGWGTVGNSTISRNIIRHFNTVGIHASPIRCGAPYTKVIGNEIYSTGRDGVYCSKEGNEIAYNDMYNVMKINNDGGVFYTVGNDTQKNMKIHHNWVHDSEGPAYADGRAAGIYLDNNSKGFDVHHNVIWNITWSALQINWYNNHIDFFNNTIWDVDEAIGRWDNGYDEDNNRVWNNVSNVGPWKISGEFAPSLKSNIIIGNLPLDTIGEGLFFPEANSALVDAGTMIEGITDDFLGDAPDIGAYERGRTPWIPGVNYQVGGEIDDSFDGFLRYVERPSKIDTLTVSDSEVKSFSNDFHRFDSIVDSTQVFDTLVVAQTINDTVFTDSTFYDSTYIVTTYFDSTFNYNGDTTFYFNVNTVSDTVFQDSVYSEYVLRDTIVADPFVYQDTTFEISATTSFTSVDLDYAYDTIVMITWVSDTLDLTGIFSGMKDDVSVLLYPNPVRESDLHVRLAGELQDIKIEVWTGKGQMVYSREENGQTISVPSAVFMYDGMYVLRFYIDGKVVTKKVLK